MKTFNATSFVLPLLAAAVFTTLALQPGRDVLANARLFATVAQAMDDAMMAVFDAKYTYDRWRPITAIRNGDADGQDGTERDAAWAPLIDTPMHPEYPCAHCILAATVATVIQAQGRERPLPLPLLSTTSPTAQGAARSWNSVEALMQEVALARIVAGVHYRSSTEVGQAMGQRIGEWAWSRGAAVDLGAGSGMHTVALAREQVRTYGASCSLDVDRPPSIQDTSACLKLPYLEEDGSEGYIARKR